MYLSASNPLLYMEIFTYEAWAMCLLLITLSTAAFLALEHVGKANFHGTNDSEKFTKSNSLAFSLSMLIQRSYAIEMSKLSARILYLAITASTLVLFAYYTCDMTSRLTGPSSIPIKSFDDVIKYGYKVIIYSGGAMETFLEQFAPQILKNSMKIPRIPNFDLNTRVQILLEHPKHLLWDEDTDTMTRKDVLSLSIDETSLIHLAFAFQLNSEFTDLFNYHLSKMDETGVIQRARYPLS